jgi:hypothetical protein
LHAAVTRLTDKCDKFSDNGKVNVRERAPPPHRCTHTDVCSTCAKYRALMAVIQPCPRLGVRADMHSPERVGTHLVPWRRQRLKRGVLWRGWRCPPTAATLTDPPSPPRGSIPALERASAWRTSGCGERTTWQKNESKNAPEFSATAMLSAAIGQHSIACAKLQVCTARRRKGAGTYSAPLVAAFRIACLLAENSLSAHAMLPAELRIFGGNVCQAVERSAVVS